VVGDALIALDLVRVLDAAALARPVVRRVRIRGLHHAARLDERAVGPEAAAAGALAAAIEHELLAEVDDLAVELRDRGLDSGGRPERPAAAALALIADRGQADAERAAVELLGQQTVLVVVGLEDLGLALAGVGGELEAGDLVELAVHHRVIPDGVAELVRL